MAFSKIKMRIMQTVLDLQNKYPYYTPYLMAMRLKEDESCPTAGMNNMLQMSYNPTFMDNFEGPELELIVHHELLHYISAHHDRMDAYLGGVKADGKTMALHNIAMDLEINSRIDPDFTVEDMMHPKRFGYQMDLTYEVYLGLLKNDMDKLKDEIDQMSNPSGKNPGSDVDMSDEGDGEGSPEGTGDGLGDGDGEDSSGNGCSPGKNNKEKSGKDVLRDLLKAEEQKIREGTSCGVGNESKPGEVKEYKLPERIYDWSMIFKKIIPNTYQRKKLGRQHTTFQKINKRNPNRRIIIPTTRSREFKFDIVVIMDVSGSMGGLTFDLYSLLRSMVKKYDCHITLLECDTEVIRIERDFKVTPTVLSVEGGGTDLTCGWDWIKANNMDPDLVICMTDGCTPWDDSGFLKEKSIVLTDSNNCNAPYKVYKVKF